MSTLSTVKKKPLPLSALDNDQLDAVTRLYEFDHTLLIGGMGSGKTVVALTAIQELLGGEHLKRVLILAPLKVCDAVWRYECAEWEHLVDLHVAIATGTPKERTAALESSAPIVVTNFDNLQWLVKQGWADKFDGLVVDESTKLKGGGTHFKKFRRYIAKFKWRVAMSGTPLSENWEQIFYQVMLVDNGITLGKNRDSFLRSFFYSTDYQQRKWHLREGMAEALTGAVAQLVHTIPPYQHTLPPLSVVPVNITLDPESRVIYDEMCNTFESGDVVADTMAVKIMKLQQISNGFLYDNEGKTIQIHDLKISEIARRKIGKLVVVYYFKEDLLRLQAEFPDAVVLGDGEISETVKNWNDGKIEILLVHPMSGGHGLNLARGGSHIIWIAPCWSRDLFDQTIARIWRRGQRFPVLVEVLTGTDTVDELINIRLQGKGTIMPLFLEHLAKHRKTTPIIALS